MEEKQDSATLFIKKIYNRFLGFTYVIIFLILLGFIVVGAGASIILLIKLFPSTALILFKALSIPFFIMFFILKAFIAFTLVSYIVYIIVKDKNKKYMEEHNARATRTRNNNPKASKQSR